LGVIAIYINTNLPALQAQRHLYNNNVNLDKSLERLSSGLRINTGADDASGLAIVEKMAAQNVGLTMAIQNTQDAGALFKIADGAFDQVAKILTRFEELTVRANNQTLTNTDRQAIQEEISQLFNQLTMVSDNTEYNTMKLLDGSLDIKKTLMVDTGVQGSIKVLAAPGTVASATDKVLSILQIASPAFVSASTIPNIGALGIQNIVNVNGTDITIAAGDTVDTVISKINNSNPKTGVIAVRLANGTVGMVTGVIDKDSTFITNRPAGDTLPNGSAAGYITAGTAATISISGDSQIWSAIGFTGTLSTYFAAGTNAMGNLDGIAMVGKGSELEMQDQGSPFNGIKMGTDMFNGAYGGYVLTGTAAGNSLASAITHMSFVADQASITTDGSKKLNIQIGANYNQSISYILRSVDPAILGNGASTKISSLKDVNALTIEDANFSLKVIQRSIVEISSIRATIGAVMNRLEYTDKTLRNQKENLSSAESKIRDADMSMEMTVYTRNQIMVQAGTAMLAQANSRPQNVLQLLKA